MSDSASPATADPSLTKLADQVLELVTEVAMLRESIVTAAEWDSQARQERQRVLDSTLATVRMRLRILVGVNMILVGLVIWLLVRAGT
jgi:hypothetical protein